MYIYLLQHNNYVIFKYNFLYKRTCRNYQHIRLATPISSPSTYTEINYKVNDRDVPFLAVLKTLFGAASITIRNSERPPGEFCE